MLEFKELLQLMKVAAKASTSAPTSYSFNGQNLSGEAINEALREELKELCGTNALYRENKNTIFSLIEQTLDEVLPKKVTESYMQFAEVKVFGQGDKPIFRRKLNSNNRAKQFITRVGLAGVYEVFKLGKSSESFQITTSAIGGAAQIGFEEFLDGRVDFNELIDIVSEGMNELIYDEIGKTIEDSANQLPAMNRVTSDGFDESAFDGLVRLAESYGTVTIYCTDEFALQMIPQEAWRYSDAMKDELYRTGRLKGYKNKNIVILPNAYKDVLEGKEKVIDPSICLIIPSGADQKPVKVAFEGTTHIKEFDDNRDWSRELHTYQKVGVTCMMDNAICIYKDTSLSKSGAFKLTDTVKDVVYTKPEGQFIIIKQGSKETISSPLIFYIQEKKEIIL